MTWISSTVVQEKRFFSFVQLEGEIPITVDAEASRVVALRHRDSMTLTNTRDNHIGVLHLPQVIAFIYLSRLCSSKVLSFHER